MREGKKIYLKEFLMKSQRNLADYFFKMNYIDDPSEIIFKGIFINEICENITPKINGIVTKKDKIFFSYEIEQELYQKSKYFTLYGVFLCSRIFSKCLIKNGGGKIINIASLKGQLGSEGQCNYSAAKAGVIGLTKALAKEFGPYNISVNAVCPGFAVTDLNKDNENKVMYAMEMSTMTTEYTKSDLSNFIAFLCSDAIKGVSGRIFNLDSRIM